LFTKVKAARRTEAKRKAAEEEARKKAEEEAAKVVADKVKADAAKAARMKEKVGGKRKVRAVRQQHIGLMIP
jgi:hypothetical protein